MNFKITYAVTVCDEDEELNKLLSLLSEKKREDDEILVQADKTNTTKKVEAVAKKYKVKFIKFPLNNDFASFKNNLKKECSGDYIFQIDADEIPSEETVSNLHKIIENNLDIELFLVPRINIVSDITEDHFKKWDWKLGENGWINWPDYQFRIFKNNFNIKWKGKVHETIEGANTGVQLPATAEYALIHIKDIEKQEKQNELYGKIQ
jgi:glycosyltransferase involved in cell wall biosynthesis